MPDAQNQRLLYGLKKQHVVELLRPGGVDAEQQALGMRCCSVWRFHGQVCSYVHPWCDY